MIQKTGLLIGDPLELRQRGVPVHRKVGPGSRCDLQVAPQDGCPVTGLDLFQVHLLAAAAAQHGTTPCQATRTLSTQFASLPSIDTRYRPPSYSATTTGNETRRPV